MFRMLLLHSRRRGRVQEGCLPRFLDPFPFPFASYHPLPQPARLLRRRYRRLTRRLQVEVVSELNVHSTTRWAGGRCWEAKKSV